jgi:hypothetical protein
MRLALRNRRTLGKGTFCTYSLSRVPAKTDPYNGCVANKAVKGKRVMISFYIDDCKISHKISAIIDNTIAWLRVEYKRIFKDGSWHMKVHRGKAHKYLGMSLDFSHKGQCRVTIHDSIDGILHTYNLAIKDHDDGYQIFGKCHSKMSAAPDNLFMVNEDCKKLSNEAAATFHAIGAKALYLYVTKKARPDISLAIAFLTTGGRSPNTEN